jgi:exportin-1
MGTMLSDQGPQITIPRDIMIVELLALQNNVWKRHMNLAAGNAQAAAGMPGQGGQMAVMGQSVVGVAHLYQLDVIKELSKIVKINVKVCSSAGSIYLHQLSVIFQELLSLYRLYGEKVKEAVDTHGVIAVRWTDYKAMRHLKSDILELLTAAIECSGETGPTSIEIFKSTFFPGMMTDILTDYKLSPPSARDSKVLSLFAQALTTFKESMSGQLGEILETVLEKTLEMITQNMLDYPEHRIHFFNFLRQANLHCFYALFSIPPNYQRLVIDSIVWAFKHTERNISETGLEILNELLHNVSNAAANNGDGSSFAQGFFGAFFLPLMQDVFGVLTDRLHKSGFVLQASILMQLFHSVQCGRIQVPLHSLGPQVDNVTFLKDHLCGLLLQTFPNCTKTQVQAFTRGLFDLQMDINAFKQHLRDFLITIKEFATEDNSDLFLEEEQAKLDMKRKEEYAYLASVPGMIKPSERSEDDD